MSAQAMPAAERRLPPRRGGRALRTALLCAAVAGFGGCEQVTFPFYEAELQKQRVTPPEIGLSTLDAEPEAAVTRPTPPETAPSLQAPLIVPGTDATVRRSAGRPTPLTGARAGEVTLNFVDADLREVLRAVLGDVLGLSYVVDPNVQGSVTLRTSRPLAMSAVLPAVEDILAVNGAALVVSDGLYKVVPADQVLRSGGATRVQSAAAPSGRGAGVVIVPLRYASAIEMQKVLEPFTPPGGTVTADLERNALVVGGGSGDINTILDIVETFDVDLLSGRSFGLFPIKTTNAETMVANLEEVFGNQETGPLNGLVRFVPIERLNAVLVISARSSYLEKAGEWIARLDAGEEELPQIFVYYAENSRAGDLAAVLGEVFPAREGATRSPLAPGLRATEVRSSRSSQRLTRRGSTDIQLATLADGADANPIDLRQLQTQEPGGGARQLGAEGRQRGLSQQDQRGTARRTDRLRDLGFGQDRAETLDVGPYGEVRIIADEVKNAVVVYAKPRAYRLIEQAIRKLDSVPMQVLIEAAILEVRLNDELRYGVEWFLHAGDFGITSAPVLNSLGLSAGSPAPLGGFTAVFRTSDFRAIINALERVTDVNVVSSPQIFVLDNQTASIVVGDQVPISTRTSQSVISPDAPIVSSVEYVDTGVILTVTPRVNQGGLVNMDIVQEVSDAVQNTTSQIDSPTIRQRRIESSVAVQNGQSVALGGLIADSRTKGSEGIPFLSRLPIIGPLFGTKTDIAGRTELLVLITPRVVPNSAEARRVTDELRQRVRRVLTLEGRIQ